MNSGVSPANALPWQPLANGNLSAAVSIKREMNVVELDSPLAQRMSLTCVTSDGVKDEVKESVVGV